MEYRGLKKKFSLFLAGTLLPILIRIFGWTWRVRFVGAENEGAPGTPIVWAFWHARLLPLVYFYRNRGIVVLVSMSFDGEIISRVLEKMGFRTIRGSTSRGGARSIVAIVNELKKGNKVALTPDGPRGPKEIAQIGTSAVSAISGIPIVVTATASSASVKLKSWDGFRIPFPFAKIEIRQSAPIFPNGRTPKEILVELQRTLEETTRLADESFAKNKKIC